MKTCIFIKVVQKYSLCHTHIALACLQLTKKVVRVLVGMVRYELNNYMYIKQILHQTRGFENTFSCIKINMNFKSDVDTCH